MSEHRPVGAASRMVAPVRVELTTPASSGQRSTGELQGHSGLFMNSINNFPY